MKNSYTLLFLMALLAGAFVFFAVNGNQLWQNITIAALILHLTAWGPATRRKTNCMLKYKVLLDVRSYFMLFVITRGYSPWAYVVYTQHWASNLMLVIVLGGVASLLMK
jgi:hypothetical protein